MAKFLDLDGLAKYTEALRANMVESVNGRKGKVTISKTDVSLGNVTNDSQVKRSEMAKAGGVATLDASGKVPAAQLPSYVDDVLMFASRQAFPATGEEGKIYVSETDNKTYRWAAAKTVGEVTTSAGYVEVSASLALGENSSTAFPGDRGKTLETKVANVEKALNGDASNQGLISTVNENREIALNAITVANSKTTPAEVKAEIEKFRTTINSALGDGTDARIYIADHATDIEKIPALETWKTSAASTLQDHTESINGLLAWTTSMVAITDSEIDTLFK